MSEQECSDCGVARGAEVHICHHEQRDDHVCATCGRAADSRADHEPGCAAAERERLEERVDVLEQQLSVALLRITALEREGREDR